MDMGRMAWVLFGVCAALRPAGRGPADRGAAPDLVAALRHRRSCSQAQFTLANYQTALSLGPGAHRAGQQPDAGLRRGDASACWSWRCWSGSSTARSSRGRGAIEYLVMFPQAVPRLVFGLGAAVGLAQHPDPDLRHAVAAGAGLFHGACCRSACARWPAWCCRSTRAWRNARASAAPAGATRCAPSPCRCSSPASWRPGC